MFNYVFKPNWYIISENSTIATTIIKLLSIVTLTLTDAVEAHTTNVTARRGQSSFTLTCSLLGYAPAQKLRWWFQNINKEASTIEEVTSGLHHTVTHTAGDSMIQMGGASPEKSVVSTLTVLDVGASDAGTYLCGTHLDDVTMISVDVIQSQAGGIYNCTIYSYDVN